MKKTLVIALSIAMAFGLMIATSATVLADDTASVAPMISEEAAYFVVEEAPVIEEVVELVEIEAEEIPLSALDATPVATWAFLNLVLAVCIAAVSIVLLIGYFVNRNSDREYADEDEDSNGILRVFSVIPGVCAGLVFGLTQNTSNTMVMADKWTLAMALIAMIQTGMVMKVHQDDAETRRYSV